MGEKILVKYAHLIVILFVCFVRVYCLISIHYYNVDKAAAYLTNHANSQSQYECARYVVGNSGRRCPTYIHPSSAKEYDAFLPKLCF